MFRINFNNIFKKIDYNQFSYLVLIISYLFIGYEIYYSLQIDKLAAYDTYYWLNLVKYTVTTFNIPQYIPNTFINYPIAYPTFFINFTAILSIITNIQPKIIFEIMGPITFGILLAVFYELENIVLDNKLISSLSLLMLASMNYLVYRSTMYLPEMFGLIFILSILITLYDENNIIKKMLLLSLLLTAHIYMHYRSIFISIFLILFYFIFIYNDSIKTKFIILIKIYFISFILSGYISFCIFRYYFELVFNNSWSSKELALTRYSLLTFERYINDWTILVTILFIIGIIYSIKKYSKRNFGIFYAWFVISFLLTLAPLFNIYAPPYRFLSYLSLPVAFFSSLGVLFLISKINQIQISINFKKLLHLIIIVVIISNFYISNSNFYIFVPYTNSDFEAIAWLQNNSNESSVVLSYGNVAISFNITNAEPRPEIISMLLALNNSQALISTINTLYNSSFKVAYFLIISRAWNILRNKNPNIDQLFENIPIVYNKTNTRIYKIDLNFR